MGLRLREFAHPAIGCQDIGLRNLRPIVSRNFVTNAYIVTKIFRRIATKGNISDGGVGAYKTGRSGSMGNEHMVQQQTGNAQHFRYRLTSGRFTFDRAMI